MDIYDCKLGPMFVRGHIKNIKAMIGTIEDSPRKPFGNYLVNCLTNSHGNKTYAIRDQTAVVAFLHMEKYQQWKAMEECVVWTDPSYRGKGLIYHIYDTFIKKDNGILISDDLHTPYAIAMWKKFVKHHRYKIYAIDLLNPRHKAHVYWNNEHDDIEFAPTSRSVIPALWFGDSEETDSLHKDHDIRLIAHK